MALKNVLIEGLSGSGKTTVAEELERRGFQVIHGDRTLAYFGDPETGVPLTCPNFGTPEEKLSWLHAHWIWPENRVRSLIADEAVELLFFCGGSRNHDRFIDLFDDVIVLDVDLDTLLLRLSKRPADEFGGKPIEREFVAQRYPSREDLPQQAIRLDGTAPVGEVVAAILSNCRSLDRHS